MCEILGKKMRKGGILDKKSMLTAEAVRNIVETYGVNMRAIVVARPSERVRVLQRIG